jgi:hypothetical protein
MVVARCTVERIPGLSVRTLPAMARRVVVVTVLSVGFVVVSVSLLT